MSEHGSGRLRVWTLYGDTMFHVLQEMSRLGDLIGDLKQSPGHT